MWRSGHCGQLQRPKSKDAYPGWLAGCCFVVGAQLKNLQNPFTYMHIYIHIHTCTLSCETWGKNIKKKINKWFYYTYIHTCICSKLQLLTDCQWGIKAFLLSRASLRTYSYAHTLQYVCIYVCMLVYLFIHKPNWETNCSQMLRIIKWKNCFECARALIQCCLWVATQRQIGKTLFF